MKHNRTFLMALGLPFVFKVEVRAIALESMFSTNGQQGLKQMSDAFRKGPDGLREYVEPYGRELTELRQGIRSGASNIFLVRGRDISAAVKATRLLFTACPSADIPGFALALGEGYRQQLVAAARDSCWRLGQDWENMIVLGDADDTAGLFGAGRCALRSLR